MPPKVYKSTDVCGRGQEEVVSPLIVADVQAAVLVHPVDKPIIWTNAVQPACWDTHTHQAWINSHTQSTILATLEDEGRKPLPRRLINTTGQAKGVPQCLSILFYLIVTCFILSAMLYLALPCFTMLYSDLPCSIPLYPAQSCYTLLYLALPCCKLP